MEEIEGDLPLGLGKIWKTLKEKESETADLKEAGGRGDYFWEEKLSGIINREVWESHDQKNFENRTGEKGSGNS